MRSEGGILVSPGSGVSAGTKSGGRSHSTLSAAILLKSCMRQFLEMVGNFIQFHINFLYDAHRFIRYSGVWRNGNVEVMIAWVRADIHKLEKGLSLPAPRPGFGLYVYERLSGYISRLQQSGAHLCSTDLSWLSEVNHRYLEFQSLSGIVVNRRHSDTVEAWIESHDIPSGAADNVRATQNDAHTGNNNGESKGDFDFHNFAWSRSSVREFDSSRSVSHEDIMAVVDIARKTPSVCNRQTSRVHVFTEPDVVRQVLKYQRGNAGFGHQVPAVAIITSDISQFFSVDERNQMWVDGGMFAMSFVYGLHARGLGSCCLNWSISSKGDRSLRNTGFVPDHENIIMMVAFGYSSHKSDPPSSLRMDAGQIVNFNPPPGIRK